MTKAAVKRELRIVKSELDWLLWCEQRHNPDWRFHPAPYSKRRVRLVKMYWALKAMTSIILLTKIIDDSHMISCGLCRAEQIRKTSSPDPNIPLFYTREHTFYQEGGKI